MHVWLLILNKKVVPISKAKFSSEGIGSQYNLIKMLLAESEKYGDAINAIKKDIAYMPIELKKKLEEEKLYYEWNKSGIYHGR